MVTAPVAIVTNIENVTYLFASELYMKSPTDPFGFASVRSVVIVIRDTTSDPMSWKYEVYTIPHTDQDFELSSTVYAENGFLYILGRASTIIPVLARIRYRRYN
jgi:hypothetical protein